MYSRGLLSLNRHFITQYLITDSFSGWGGLEAYHNKFYTEGSILVNLHTTSEAIDLSRDSRVHSKLDFFTHVTEHDSNTSSPSCVARNSQLTQLKLSTVKATCDSAGLE